MRVKFFLSHLYIQNKSEIDKFRLIPPHCRLRMIIFLIEMRSPKIPSLLRRDRDIFLLKKNIRTRIVYFFILLTYTKQE